MAQKKSPETLSAPPTLLRGDEVYMNKNKKLQELVEVIGRIASDEIKIKSSYPS